MKAELARCQQAWRRVVACAVEAGVPVPGFSSALGYYDQVRAPRLNAALTQGLRDLLVPTRTGALTTKVLGTSIGQVTVAKSAPTESSLHEGSQPWPSCLFLPHATP